MGHDVPVKIICKTHGEFLQHPDKHLRGYGCKKCGCERISEKLRSDTKTFVSKARIKHRDRYDYSKTEYIDSKIKVEIICKKHGSFFQKPCNHLGGRGCPVCNGDYEKEERFILESKTKFSNRFLYHDTKYLNSNKNITIECVKHGKLSLKPEWHLLHGCPHCLKDDRIKQIIERFKKHHGNKYDYSKAELGKEKKGYNRMSNTRPV